METSDGETAREDGGTSSPTAAIQSAIQIAMQSSMDNFSKVIEDKFQEFAQKFSEENTNTLEKAVLKAKRETFTCKRKGNQQQLDHSLQVLEKIHDSSRYLKSKSFEKAKRSLDESSELVLKRIKAIKLADKSEYGWATVNEYLSDELASDSEDEKRIYRSEERAKRKAKEKQRQRKEKRANYDKVASARDSSRSRSGGTIKQLGPCFKISIFCTEIIYLTLLHFA